MGLIRALFIAVVTVMAILGPAAAAERAAERADCAVLAFHGVDTDPKGSDWAAEARLFYCQVAASILPEGWSPAPPTAGAAAPARPQARLDFLSVMPAERPPRVA